MSASGRVIALEPTPLPVKPLLNEAVEALRLQAEEKHQKLSCKLTPGVTHVLADHDRVLQALANLLGNAMKFATAGGHTCLCAVCRGEQPRDIDIQFDGVPQKTFA